MAACDTARHPDLQSFWIEIWKLALRTLPSPTTTRTACNLMATMLRFEVLDYLAVADTIDSMVTSININGPSLLTDGALSMWSEIIHKRTKTNQRQAQEISNQVCGWLRSTWTLGTFPIV